MHRTGVAQAFSTATLGNLLELTSPLSGSGRRFEPTTERALEPAMRTLAASLPGSAEGVLAIPEFPGPVGIPDFLAITRAHVMIRRRLDTGIAPLTSAADARLVAAMPVGRKLKLETIAHRTGLASPVITRRLARLADQGAVIGDKTGFRRHPALIPVGRMYALEAKVSDWQQGIAQALRYVQWADAAGVLLLKPPRDLGSMLQLARAVNIGVAVGDKWILRPTIRPPRPGLQLLASERAVAATAALPQ